MTASLAPHHAHDQLARLRAAMEAPSGRVVFVNVPMGNYLMVDGRGGAEDESFGLAVRALADLSAGLRLYLQEGGGTLLDPMPLEILWAAPADDVWREATVAEWSWTAMIAQPARVSPEMVHALRERLAGTHDHRLLCHIHLGSLREGLCAQTASLGRSERGADVLGRLIEHVRASGHEPHGPRHEIYLADLRHAAAGPLRTIVRQPIHRPA